MMSGAHARLRSAGVSWLACEDAPPACPAPLPTRSPVSPLLSSVLKVGAATTAKKLAVRLTR